MKERVQILLAAEAEMLYRAGLSPNAISGMGMLFAFLAGLAYFSWQYDRILLLVGPILLLLSGFWDTMDGIVARTHGDSTAFGGFLDSLLDRYADAFVLTALIASGLCDSFWGSIALVGSVLVSYTRARAESCGVRMETIGLTERGERILIIVASSVVAYWWLEALEWGIRLLAVLANLTVLQRTIHFHNAVERGPG